MQILQAAIAQDLAAIQVVVELNPSSNLSIGALEKPVDQPLFQLRPWGKRAQHAVPVTLSADDPLQLATCHSDELAYAWAGMVAGANVAPAEANAWLEQAVADAWRGRFAVACRPGPPLC
jgi:adenosine deaminase